MSLRGAGGLLGSYFKYITGKISQQSERAEEMEHKEEMEQQQLATGSKRDAQQQTQPLLERGQIRPEQLQQQPQLQQEENKPREKLIGEEQVMASSRKQQQYGKNTVPKTMKAARVVEFGKPMEIQDVDVPEPGPGQALVRVTFCGVCHTDLEMMRGSLSLKPDLPRTIGHEGVGEVFKVGPDVEHVHEGDRVLCGVLASTCGCCSDCLEGCENSCSEHEFSGISRDGHMAQFFLANADYLCKIPEHLKSEEVAPMNCAGVTSWKALKVSGLRCGQWVMIVGAGGGLGYYGVQFAKAMGLKVLAVDKGKEKMNFLEQFEGIHMLDCSNENFHDQVMKLTDNKGVHAAIVIAPTKEAFQESAKYLRKRGKLIVVGQPPSKDRVEFDMASLIVNCNSVIGTVAGTRWDLGEAVNLLADGVIKSEVNVRNLDEINDILNEISEEKAFGRNVVRIPELQQE